MSHSDTVFGVSRPRPLLMVIALVAALYVILKAYHVVVFAATLYSRERSYCVFAVESNIAGTRFPRCSMGQLNSLRDCRRANCCNEAILRHTQSTVAVAIPSARRASAAFTRNTNVCFERLDRRVWVVDHPTGQAHMLVLGDVAASACQIGI